MLLFEFLSEVFPSGPKNQVCKQTQDTSLTYSEATTSCTYWKYSMKLCLSSTNSALQNMVYSIFRAVVPNLLSLWPYKIRYSMSVSNLSSHLALYLQFNLRVISASQMLSFK